jgi:hypothetical protein
VLAASLLLHEGLSRRQHTGTEPATPPDFRHRTEGIVENISLALWLLPKPRRSRQYAWLAFSGSRLANLALAVQAQTSFGFVRTISVYLRRQIYVSRFVAQPCHPACSSVRRTLDWRPANSRLCVQSFVTLSAYSILRRADGSLLLFSELGSAATAMATLLRRVLFSRVIFLPP